MDTTERIVTPQETMRNIGIRISSLTLKEVHRNLTPSEKEELIYLRNRLKKLNQEVYSIQVRS